MNNLSSTPDTINTSVIDSSINNSGLSLTKKCIIAFSLIFSATMIYEFFKKKKKQDKEEVERHIKMSDREFRM